MKKLFALTLALTMILSMFAACGNTNPPATNPPATNPPATNAPATNAPATNAATNPSDAAPEDTTAAPLGEDTIVAGSLSNHENGWEVEAWSEDSAGIYFNMWANDLPADTDWHVRYQAHSGEVVKLIRNGEVYPIGGPGIGSLVKFSTNGYYLSFDKWITQELFPLQEGDVVIVEGDFSNPDNGYTIHFDKTYIQLKVGGITKFTTTAPEGITE